MVEPRFKLPDLEISDTEIWTPNGTYMTTKELADELEAFKKKADQYAGPIGGQYNYIFTATSLGVVLVVEDEISKNKINVTNYGDW